MSQPDDGGRTQAGGTPVAVDVGGDRRARLTIAMFLAGPVIWSLHFMAVYLVTEAGCSTEGTGLDAFNPPVPTMVTLVATAAAAVASIGVAWWCHREWRLIRTGSGDRDDQQREYPEEQRRGAVLPFAGFLMALLGVVNVLFVGLPALVLPAC